MSYYRVFRKSSERLSDEVFFFVFPREGLRIIKVCSINRKFCNNFSFRLISFSRLISCGLPETEVVLEIVSWTPATF